MTSTLGERSTYVIFSDKEKDNPVSLIVIPNLT